MLLDRTLAAVCVTSPRPVLPISIQCFDAVSEECCSVSLLDLVSGISKWLVALVYFVSSSFVAFSASGGRKHQRRVALRHDRSYRGRDQDEDEHDVENSLVNQPWPGGVEGVEADERGGERRGQLGKRQRPHRHHRGSGVVERPGGDRRGNTFSDDERSHNRRRQGEVIGDASRE